MSAKSREVIWGGSIMGVDIRAKGAREAARKAVQEADRAETEAWSIRMEGYGGRAQPSPTIAQCLNPWRDAAKGWVLQRPRMVAGRPRSQRDRQGLRPGMAQGRQVTRFTGHNDFS